MSTLIVGASGATGSLLVEQLLQRGRLVSDITQRLCDAARANASLTPIRFVLMNTAGNANRDLDEPLSMAYRCVIQCLRFGLPPHRDNERAADYLRTVG